MSKLLGLLLILVVALIPAGASAQTRDEDRADFLMRVGGDVVVPAGESIGSVVVIDGNLQIDGTVRNFAMVIHGDMTVNGRVNHDLSVISGDITLNDGAVVNNVVSVRGDLNRASGATVNGHVREHDQFNFLRLPFLLFSILLWLGFAIAVVIGGLVFAAIGGRQLSAAARAMTDEFVNSIIGAVFFWIGLPILGVLAIVTLIGIPAGISVFMFLLPAFGLLGYIVAGTRLGSWVLGQARPDGDALSDHPYSSTTLGLVILTIGTLVPFIGVVVAVLAGLWGAGALAFLAYRAARGGGVPAGAEIA